jgi:hypothetical protein
MTFTEPMIATFDLSVAGIPSDRTILFYGVPAVIVIPAGLEEEKKFDRPSIKNGLNEKDKL